MKITREQLRRLITSEVRSLREASDAFGPSEHDMVLRLLNEAITLIERASQLASKGALEEPYAQELARIDDELRTFVLDMGGGDDT